MAELIGTFAICFVGVGSICSQTEVLSIALSQGLTIAVMVSATNRVSGGHLNPSVTFASLIAGKTQVAHALIYIFSQVLGAFVALLLLTRIFPVERTAILIPTLNNIQWQVGLAVEAILAFFIVFVFFATIVDERFSFKMGGVAVGFAVISAVIMAYNITGAAINPARTLAASILTGKWDFFYVWLAGPLFGGAIAAIVYTEFFIKE